MKLDAADAAAFEFDWRLDTEDLLVEYDRFFGLPEELVESRAFQGHDYAKR